MNRWGRSGICLGRDFRKCEIRSKPGIAIFPVSNHKATSLYRLVKSDEGSFAVKDGYSAVDIIRIISAKFENLSKKGLNL